MYSEFAVIQRKDEASVERIVSHTYMMKICQARHLLCVLCRAVLLQALRHASM